MTDLVRPFHLAIPVSCLAQAEQFYGGVLGCAKGRSSEQWIDWNFFGHQLVTHVTDAPNSATSNSVDGHQVPVPHFGVILDMNTWKDLAESLQQQQIAFAIKPYIRFEGQVGEQATMFFYDPFNNALEFKAFNDLSQLFAS